MYAGTVGPVGPVARDGITVMGRLQSRQSSTARQATSDARGDTESENLALPCRFRNRSADGDPSTGAFTEFQSKWRMQISAVRGGS